MLLGSFIFLVPALSSWTQKREVSKEIKAYQEACKKRKSKKDDSIYQKGKSYNIDLFKTGQIGLVDAWSYETVPASLKHMDRLFGYIRIPKMNLKLPLYLGATQKNMKKGAAILGQTSLPIGGENTNSVIAAHRGFQGVPYFRDIEKLKVNDKIFVTNPWETLEYRVETIKVIYPGDIAEIKIKPGKDMVTLLTCHPYRTHGKYRYVVYCVKDQGECLKNENKLVQMPDKTYFRSSERDILIEKMMGYIGILIIVVLFWFTMKRKGKEKKDK